MTLEDKAKKILWICDMTRPEENNTVTKQDEKRIKYRQLAFELREWRAEYKIYVAPVVIGALDGGIKEAIHRVEKIFKRYDLFEKIVGEMRRTFLMKGRKILSGLVQTDF